MAVSKDVATLVGHKEPFNHKAGSIIYSTGISVADVLEDLLSSGATTYTTDGVGVTAGDVVYVSAATKIVTRMPIDAFHAAVGVATETVAASLPVLVARQGFLVGMLSGATAGVRYFWSGTGWVTTMPVTSGVYIWAVGIAVSATIGAIDLRFIKKNA